MIESDVIKIAEKTENIKMELVEEKPTNLPDKSSSQIAKADPGVKITFAGDLMVDRHVRKIVENNGNNYDYLFRNVSEKLSESDLVVANLEGPVTTFDSLYKTGPNPDIYSFTFDPKLVESLYKANIKTVFLDNNHITDYENEGVTQTLDFLKKGNIDYFGLPEEEDILRKNIKGINLAFIAYNQFIYSDVEKIIENIKSSDIENDYVIVFTHWGNEYEFSPTSRQIELAHKFIDSGADIVIGTHPHVIQKKEIYKDKLIYYSLGNFIFDQYFNEDVKCGAVVSLDLNNNGIESITEEFISLDSHEVVSFSDCGEFDIL